MANTGPAGSLNRKWEADHHVIDGVGGDSIDELYTTFDANSQTEAFQTFVKNVASIRELRNVSLITPVKAYPATR